MSYLIKMPQMGLEMEEGEVVAWEVEEGEEIKTGDVIAVIESEKAANDIEAREDGVVREIAIPAGGTAEPGEPIGIFAESDEDISDLEAKINHGTADQSEPEPVRATEEADTGQMEDRSGTPSNTGGQATETIRATPGAKQMASDTGVDLGKIDGTGPQGTITETDIKEQASATTGNEAHVPEIGGSDDVRSTPGARQAASERGVDLSAIEGTGPQGVVTEADVKQHELDDDSEPNSVAADVRATPGAKQAASERGIDISAVEGTGPQETITEADIERHEPEDGEATRKVSAAEGESATQTVAESQTLSRIQQTVGDRMLESHQTAPHVTLNRSFDASTMLDIVTAADHAGVDISLTDLLLAGVGVELAETPEFNALYEDGEHKLIQEVNIGVAVDIDDGLVTPVVPSVADRSIESIAKIREDLTERTLSGAFEMSDMAGGTFTITNLGMFSIDSFDPIINPPEVAILGVGRVRDNGTMTLSLSFDHRVVNGADGARFLDGAVEHLNDAKWLADQFEADVLGALIDILSE